jgi:hypothetical protein
MDREQALKMIDDSLADEASFDVEDFSKVVAELRAQL